MTLWVGGPEGGAETTVEVRAVVLATGAAELVLPFPGWDLPGVTTAGAAQALLKSQGVTVGRRVLVARLRAAAAPGRGQPGRGRSARGRGAGGAGARRPFPGQAELTPRCWPVTMCRSAPAHAVVACQGAGRVERAVIARLDQDWRPRPGSQRAETVDAVHVSFGFSPALELPRALGCAEVPHPSRPAAAVACDADLATSVPGVFAAGDGDRAGGAEVAELEGYLAGTSAARYLGRADPAAHAAAHPDAAGPAGGCPAARGAARRGLPPEARLARVARRRHHRLPLRGNPLVRRQRRGGGRRAGLRAVKQATGCGTGYCRARVCGPALRYAVAAAAAPGPVVRPGQRRRQVPASWPGRAGPPGARPRPSARPPSC